MLSVPVFSQTVSPPNYANIDTNYRTYANNLFGLLEPNRVSTGLLADYGFDFTDPKIYNGSVLVDSTLMEQGLYSDLYKTIYTSRFNSSVSSMRHPSLHDSLNYIARQREVITLSGLLFKYNAIDPNAQANGKMQTVNGRLKDVYTNGVWQNPYQEFTTLAISPSAISYKLTYCKVVLPANLWLTNMGSQASSIQMDAGDGLGYRTVTMGTQISLNYADTGWKHWIFKVSLTNSQQLFSHCRIHFNNTSNMAGSNGVAARGVIDRNRNIVATELYNGVYGVAGIVISYRNQNDQVLRRPLIIAEGLDPGHIISPEEPEGINSFDDFIRSVRNSGSNDLRILISGNDVLDNNSPSEYDLIYVNWYNGTDYLQANALILEQVIRWVNANKQPLAGVRQPNIVLGSSMGGVIARMALGRMDRGGNLNGAGGFAAHETRLFVSLDAPHQGANVPLGYQAAARHATRMYVSTGGLAVAVEIIQLLRNGPSPLLNLLLADQPASRQMLTNRIDIFYNQTNATNQQFLQGLRTQWAYPVNIRNIAISNGSECAIDQEFAAGSSLLYHYRSTKTRFIGDLIFMVAGAGLAYLNAPASITIPLILPGSNKFELTIDIKSIANGGGNAVYYGNIKLTKKVLWLVPVSVNIANKTYNAPTGILPFDTYPGGFYTLTLANQPGSVSQDWMFSYNNSFFIQRRFSFIPTTSSLDIGRGNTALTNANYVARYIGATPPIVPFNTPFANFATAFNQDGSQWIFDNSNFRRLNNEPHEGLFIRNANWLAAEMAVNNPQLLFTNCSQFCTNGTITGNTTICTIQTFTAPLANGAFYDWSVDDPNLVTRAPDGNTVTLTRNGSATGTTILRVAISGACGNVNLSIPIIVGTNVTLTGTYSTASSTKTMQTVNFVPAGNIYIQYQWPGITNVSASLASGSPSGTGFYAYPGMCSFNIASGQNISINFNGTSSCGAVTATRTFIHSSYSSFVIAASPNPANNNINVTISEVPDTTVKAARAQATVINKGTKKITRMYLYDFNTNQLVKQWSYQEADKKNYSLNIAEIKSGMYVLKMERNNTTAVTKIIVE